jgi:hypothetical protein
MIVNINFRVEIILLITILFLLFLAPIVLSCTNHSPYTLFEGFVEGFVEGMTNTLEKKELPKKKEGFSNYKHKMHKSDIPLIFDKTKFSPKCCPNTYSTSEGCACITMPQYNYLKERGGNNVPFSDY